MNAPFCIKASSSRGRSPWVLERMIEARHEALQHIAPG